MYPTEFLDRILFATRYTRQLDKNGYLRFQNSKLYGERGLAKAPVTLSKYAVSMQEVNHPRLTETPFRSPQLVLFDLGPDDWLLYWRTSDTAPARRVEGIVQLPLPPLVREEKAIGADETGPATLPRSRLHLVKRPSEIEEQ